MKIQSISGEDMGYVSAICLDPSVGSRTREAMRESMAERIRWVRRMMAKGLKVFVALEKPRQKRIHYKWAGDMIHADLAVDGWVPKGLLESVPIEFALEPIKGRDSLFIDCIWVLPPFWHTGVAKRLMKSFIKSAKTYGGASVIAYDGARWFGTSIEYMPLGFFETFGFEEVARDGSRVLLHLDLGAGEQPKFIYPKTRRCRKTGETRLDVLFNSQCPWSKFMVEDIERNVKKIPGVTVNIVRTDDRKTIEGSGMSRGVFINGKPVVRRMASWKEIKSTLDEFTRKSA